MLQRGCEGHQWDSQKMVNKGDKGEEEEHVEAKSKEEEANINGKSLQGI